MHILYCDDDVDDIDFLAEVLMRIDPKIKLTSYQDPSKCLKFLDYIKPVPDYIFMDYDMRKMTGIECAIEMRKNESLKDVPLVMISTALDEKLRAKAKQSGISIAIKKTNFDELEKNVRSIIKSQ